MKSLKRLSLFLCIGALVLSACTKSSANPPDDAAMRVNSLNVYTNAQDLKLGVAVSITQTLNPINVKFVRLDYVNGHTPMKAFDSMTYQLSNNRSNWRDIKLTDYPYRGLMRVTITQDSMNTGLYTKDVLLTDSAGYIINLDTSRGVKSGQVGSCRVEDVVPKSHS